MALIIGGILALLGVAVAAYPFLRHRLPGQAPGAGVGAGAEAGAAQAGHAAADLDSIYQAIRTLQLERELGNIPAGLYREQLNGYRIQAATLLRDMERAQAGAAGPGEAPIEGWALEEEIRLARSALPGEMGAGPPEAPPPAMEGQEAPTPAPAPQERG